jgi:hypothetical protein
MRFAPGMIAAVIGHSRFRVIWTVIEAVDQTVAASLTIRKRCDSLVNRIDIVLSEFPPRHARLIGDHDQAEPGIAQGAQAVGDTIEQANLMRIAQVAGVVNQRIVAIKKNCRLHDKSLNVPTSKCQKLESCSNRSRIHLHGHRSYATTS